MSKLEEFLSDLSNSELATFVAYRYSEFQPASKKKISKIVHERNLNAEDLIALFNKGIQSKQDSDYNCPLCQSDRYHIEQDHEMQTRQYYSYEVIIESNKCQICGYNHSKRKPKSFIDALRIKMQRTASARIPQPNERIFKELL